VLAGIPRVIKPAPGLRVLVADGWICGAAATEEVKGDVGRYQSELDGILGKMDALKEVCT
jgi:hypothetical protein